MLECYAIAAKTKHFALLYHESQMTRFIESVECVYVTMLVALAYQ